MSVLGNAVSAKLDQWANEALMFCARHGREGGQFDVYRWANGVAMAEPIIGYETSGINKGAAIHARANQCITIEQLNELRRNGWKVYG